MENRYFTTLESRFEKDNVCGGVVITLLDIKITPETIVINKVWHFCQTRQI